MEYSIEERILSAYPDASVQVSVSGRNVEIKIESLTLSTFNRVQQQKKIYACINELISEGIIHAVSIKISK